MLKSSPVSTTRSSRNHLPRASPRNHSAVHDPTFPRLHAPFSASESTIYNNLLTFTFGLLSPFISIFHFCLFLAGWTSVLNTLFLSLTSNPWNTGNLKAVYYL
jgi:hypothetical protein